MGAKCFCGCARRMPLRKLVLRSHNNRGHDVVKSIARVRNGLAEKGREPDAGERDRATTSDSPHARRLHHAVRALAQASEEAQRAEVLLRLDLPSASEAVHLRERVS